MAFDPAQAFQVGQKMGKDKQSSLGRTSDYMSDLFKERDKEESGIDKILKGEIIKNMFTSPKEQAMTDYYKASTDALNNPQTSNDISSVAGQAGYSEDDYILKPTITRYKGQLRVENAPTLKDPLDAKSTDELGAFRSTRQNLQNNLNLMNQNVKDYMNPLDPRSGRSGIGNFALKTQSFFGDQSANDFLTFKAETDKVFQEFRKATTGAQAALKELGWLEPDYPSPSDPPDLYTQKANEAMRRLEKGESLLLDLYSQRGFRTSELRKGMNPIQQAASNQSEDALVREALANAPNKKTAILAEYKRKTGREYGS